MLSKSGHFFPLLYCYFLTSKKKEFVLFPQWLNHTSFFEAPNSPNSRYELYQTTVQKSVSQQMASVHHELTATALSHSQTSHVARKLLCNSIVTPVTMLTWRDRRTNELLLSSSDKGFREVSHNYCATVVEEYSVHTIQSKTLMQTYSVKNSALRNLKWSFIDEMPWKHSDCVGGKAYAVSGKQNYLLFRFLFSVYKHKRELPEAVNQSSECWTGDVFEVVGATSAPRDIWEWERPVAGSLWWAEAIYWLTVAMACVSTEFRKLSPRAKVYILSFIINTCV